MKKEGKLIGILMALLMLSIVFSGCITQKSTSTVTQEPSTTTPVTQEPSTTDTTPTQSKPPVILVGMSYDTETVNNNNHIYLSIQNYGGVANNAVIVISNDYYSNFTLERVEPTIRVEGNRFYVGNIGEGEKFVLDIYLKAKQSGVYTGTISYTYDGLESSTKIKDLTTKVP